MSRTNKYIRSRQLRQINQYNGLVEQIQQWRNHTKILRDSFCLARKLYCQNIKIFTKIYQLHFFTTGNSELI